MNVDENVFYAREQITDYLYLIGEGDDAEEIERYKAEVAEIISDNREVCGMEDSDGFLPLHIALQARVSLPVLEILVSCFSRALDFARGSDGHTPLHFACRDAEGFPPEVIRLLTTPKNAWRQDYHGSLPLHLYCRTNGLHPLELEAIRVLMAAYPDSILQADRGGGLTPLHWALLDFCEEDIAAIQFMVESCPQAVGKVQKGSLSEGKTALHLACGSYSDLEPPHGLHLIRSLLDACPEAVKILNKNGNTPLHQACICSSPDSMQVIRTLVQAWPDSVKSLNHDGWTPMHTFCRDACNQDLPAVEFLLDKYPEVLRQKDSYGNTPLHILASGAPNRANMMELARFIVNKCPDVLEDDNETITQGTPLHLFCKRALFNHYHLAQMKVLAISEKAVKARNSLGETPMHLLCKKGGSRDFLEVLLENCPTLAIEKDQRGRIPLHAALEGAAMPSQSLASAYAHYDETVQCLLEVFPDGVRATDNDGLTPLELACEKDFSLSES